MRYIIGLVVTLLFVSYGEAQVHRNLNANLGLQPGWGPTGYDHVEYYYVPDIDAFYSVPHHKFIYFERGRWITCSSLPARFGDVNLYKSFIVVVPETTPFRYHTMYKEKYSTFRGRLGEVPIQQVRDSTLFANATRSSHGSAVKQQKIGQHHQAEKARRGRVQSEITEASVTPIRTKGQ